MPNPEITNYETGDLVLRDGRYADLILNAAGAGTWVSGTVLAFDASAGKWKKTVSGTAAVANAKAILREEVVFSGAGDKFARCVIGGVVAAGKLVFDGSDTLDTIPASADDSLGLQLRAYGIIAEAQDEQMLLDNQ